MVNEAQVERDGAQDVGDAGDALHTKGPAQLQWVAAVLGEAAVLCHHME